MLLKMEPIGPVVAGEITSVVARPRVRQPSELECALTAGINEVRSFLRALD